MKMYYILVLAFKNKNYLDVTIDNLVGTLFKQQENKPSILKEFSEDQVGLLFRTKYLSVQNTFQDKIPFRTKKMSSLKAIQLW